MQRSHFIFSIFAPPLLFTCLLLFTLSLLATAPAFSQPAPARDPSAIAPGAAAEAAHPNESGTAPAPDQSPAREGAHPNENGTAPANSNDPQIVVDKKNHAVRILIGGKEIVIIDARGMHVNGGLDYSGILKDTGGVPYAK